MSISGVVQLSQNARKRIFSMVMFCIRSQNRDGLIVPDDRLQGIVILNQTIRLTGSTIQLLFGERKRV
jgi:hypothetical protein